MVEDVLPIKCTNCPVPYMTDGDFLGEKSVLYVTQQFLVEELRLDNDCVFRRLVDLSCPDQV